MPKNVLLIYFIPIITRKFAYYAYYKNLLQLSLLEGNFSTLDIKLCTVLICLNVHFKLYHCKTLIYFLNCMPWCHNVERRYGSGFSTDKLTLSTGFPLTQHPHCLFKCTFFKVAQSMEFPTSVCRFKNQWY